jgi:hypothetical protein
MLRAWKNELAHDPFYNVNLSNDAEHCFQLSCPPRRRRSWN